MRSKWHRAQGDVEAAWILPQRLARTDFAEWQHVKADPKQSRTRNPRASNRGGYILTDVCKRLVVLGGGTFAYSATLDEVEAYLVRPVGTVLA
jgi:hypothetical protein